MPTLSKADAARHLGIARSTLYKLIDQGKVSPRPDGRIDQAELVRVAPVVDTLKERAQTSADVVETLARGHEETPYGRPQTSDRERLRTEDRERAQTSADVLVDILREQIQVLRDELQEARQSAQAARERETLLLRMVEQMQHRYDRLLDLPRTPPPAPPPPQAARRLQQPGPSTYDAHPAIARIRTLRQQGLSFARIAAQLDAEGLPARHARPWHPSSVRFLFRAYGTGE